MPPGPRRRGAQPVIRTASAVASLNFQAGAPYLGGMESVILVFLGGGLGSALRHLAQLGAAALFGPFGRDGGFPWGTLGVNVAGCVAMGLLFRWLAAEGAGNARLLLMTGVLGGFTTYSAFALDAAQLAMRGDIGAAMLYIGGTLAGALGGVAIGLVVGKAVFG
jgi:CrcB protein